MAFEVILERTGPGVKGRGLSRLAHALLERTVRERTGAAEPPRLALGEHGKPFFPSRPDLQFNLSHTVGVIALAIGDEPVGIDVERIPTRLDEEVAAFCCNARELAEIRAAPRPELEFIRLWTRKEAYLKLLGTGIRDDMKTVLECTEGVSFRTDERIDEGFVVTVAAYF